MCDERLRRQLLDLWAHDQAVRSELATTGELFDGYAPRMQQVHDANASALDEIIVAHGFPTISMVGEDGAEAAWRIVQHAIAQPAFMQRSLPLLEAAAAQGEANPQDVAFLSDRIAVFQEHPQRYGTQFDWDANGEISPAALDDMNLVEQRRAALGMESLASLRVRVRIETKQHGAVPPNYAERRAAQHAWAVTVGWISE